MFRSKYLAKMQQGGVPSVFAPNPQPYRAPLQGLNPNVFQYNINTAPLDTSNLIQVMQTKDVNDLRREQAALEREKLKAEADLAKMKFEHQKAKAQQDFNFDMMEKIIGKTAAFSGINNQIPFEDYTMSNRYKAQYEPIVNEMRVAEKGLMDMVTTTPYGDAMFLRKFNDGMTKIETAKKKLIPLEWFKLDDAAYEKANSIMIAPKGDERVYAPQFMRISEMRRQYLNDGVDNGYKANFATDPALVYNQKEEAAKLAETFKMMNTPQPITSFDTDPSGENEFNQYIQVDKKNFVPTADKAAELMAAKILADPKQTSYVSSIYGIDFHDPSTSLDAKKKILKGIIQPQLEFDDDLLRSKSDSYRITQTAPKPDVNVNYNVSGGRNDKKTYEGGADFNFKHSGIGSKAGASKKEKEQFEAQVNNNTVQILRDNNIKDSDGKMIDRIADAVNRVMSKYPNLTDFAPNDVIQKAWSDAIDNYNALPSDKKTDRALDTEFEKALKTNYKVDLSDVGKKAEEQNEYRRLASKLTKTSTWQDLKTSDSPLVKDSKGKLRSDADLRLIFSVVKNTAAAMNLEKIDFNSAPPSIKSQLQNKNSSFNLNDYYPQN